VWNAIVADERTDHVFLAWIPKTRYVPTSGPVFAPAGSGCVEHCSDLLFPRDAAGRDYHFVYARRAGGV
jgi:hypothetical protein